MTQSILQSKWLLNVSPFPCSSQLFFFNSDFFIYYLFIIYFLAVLGLRFCARAFSSCGKRGPLFIAAPLVAEHRLQTRRLSSCGSWAQLLRGMWDPPRPGLEPVSPALAGSLSTTAPPGKPHNFLKIVYTCICRPYSSVLLTEKGFPCNLTCVPTIYGSCTRWVSPQLQIQWTLSSYLI